MLFLAICNTLKCWCHPGCMTSFEQPKNSTNKSHRNISDCHKLPSCMERPPHTVGGSVFDTLYLCGTQTLAVPREKSHPVAISFQKALHNYPPFKHSLIDDLLWNLGFIMLFFYNDCFVVFLCLFYFMIMALLIFCFLFYFIANCIENSFIK